MGLKKSEIEKTFKSLSAKSLKNMTITYNGMVFNYDEIALLVIDVQEEFCDPEHKEKRGNKETIKISEKIQSIVPEFRKANIPVYAVYFSYKKISNPENIDFFKFKPEKTDILVRKSTDSAFKGSNIKSLLTKDKKKLLITCGFNLNACVERTVIDAIDHGFEVCIIEDLTGNGQMSPKRSWPHCYKFTKAEGISKSSSSKLLKIFEKEAVRYNKEAIKSPKNAINANDNHNSSLWRKYFGHK